MGSKYTVEQFTITRDAGDVRSGWNTWDDESDRDVMGFDTLDEAKKAFAEVDVRSTWMTEKECSNLQLMQNKVMAAELAKNELDEDGEVIDSERLDYKEFGLADYEASQE